MKDEKKTAAEEFQVKFELFLDCMGIWIDELKWLYEEAGKDYCKNEKK